MKLNKKARPVRIPDGRLKSARNEQMNDSKDKREMKMDSKSTNIAIGFGFIMIIAMVMFITAMIESNERTRKAQELRKSKLEYQVGDACGMYVVSVVSVKNKVFTNLLHVKTGEKLYFYEEQAVSGFCKHAFNSPEYQLLK